ncbi:unnamed protein product [Merluccius merluccius]
MSILRGPPGAGLRRSTGDSPLRADSTSDKPVDVDVGPQTGGSVHCAPDGPVSALSGGGGAQVVDTNQETCPPTDAEPGTDRFRPRLRSQSDLFAQRWSGELKGGQRDRKRETEPFRAAVACWKQGWRYEEEQGIKR